MKRFGWIAVLGLLALAACGGRPQTFDYVPGTEIPPGRGVFTGEKGEYSIYRQ